MSQEIIGSLKALKLHGMAANYPEVAAQARHTDFSPEAFLSQLLRAEQAERSVRSMAYQMGAARFPAHRDLAGFEFSQASVDEALVRTLHGGAFIEAAHNVVLIGGPGTGKTHLATAIGIEAIQRHGKRVRFFSTVELVNALELEKSQGKAGQLAHRLVYMDLVILDELGYLPFSQAGGALLFGVDPVPWTHHSLCSRSRKCQKYDRRTRRNSASRWSSWFEPGAHPRSSLVSSVSRPSPSPTGSARPPSTTASLYQARKA